MDMPAIALFSPIELIAINPARNIRRRYAICVTPDLFGAYIVETSWGRIGARGQSKCFSFPDRAGAERHVAAILRRRGTAENRIGVAYRAVKPAFSDRSSGGQRAAAPMRSSVTALAAGAA